MNKKECAQRIWSLIGAIADLRNSKIVMAEWERRYPKFKDWNEERLRRELQLEQARALAFLLEDKR